MRIHVDDQMMSRLPGEFLKLRAKGAKAFSRLQAIESRCIVAQQFSETRRILICKGDGRHCELVVADNPQACQADAGHGVKGRHHEPGEGANYSQDDRGQQPCLVRRISGVSEPKTLRSRQDNLPQQYAILRPWDKLIGLLAVASRNVIVRQ